MTRLPVLDKMYCQTHPWCCSSATADIQTQRNTVGTMIIVDEYLATRRRITV